MKKRNFLLVLSVFVMLLSMQINTFAQEMSSHWASEIMSELNTKGLLKGYEDGSFRPDNKIARVEFVALINRIMQWEEPSEIVFSDVKADDWFAKEVKTAFAKGYVKGYQDGSFMPNANLSRAEAAMMISKVINTSTQAAQPTQFTDGAEIPAWAKEAVEHVAMAGVIKGYPDGSFKPKNEITRAEAFAMMHKVLKMEEMKNSTTKIGVNDVLIEQDRSVLKDKTIKGNVIIGEKIGRRQR